MPFPEFLDPIALQLGPLAIRWYALAYIGGILLGWWYALRLVKTPAIWRPGQAPALPADIDDFILWATLGIIIGGRVGYVFVYDQDLLWREPLATFAVWRGGMSFHGGLVGVILTTIIFARSKRIPLLSLADIVAAATPFGLFFGRLSNFINAELWGRPTDAPWGVVFPGAGMLPRHPSQLYEAALEGFLLFILLRILTHKLGWLRYSGAVAGVFLMVYSLSRMAVEYWFREPDAHMPDLPLGLTTGLLLSAPMLLLGLGMTIWGLSRKRDVS